MQSEGRARDRGYFQIPGNASIEKPLSPQKGSILSPWKKKRERKKGTNEGIGGRDRRGGSSYTYIRSRPSMEPSIISPSGDRVVLQRDRLNN